MNNYKPRQKSPAYWRDMPFEDRFWGRVRKGPGCWVWLGSCSGRGYGSLSFEGKRSARAHRVSWVLANGPIPDGLFVCHKCDNPPCVRLDHLFLGTHDENMTDMTDKGRRFNNFAVNVYPHPGESNGFAKLTEVEVRTIRQMYSGRGGWTFQKLADKFHVSKKLILLIVHRRAWTHVE
jgi:hypothetical protein